MTPERWRQIEQVYHAVVARPEGERAGVMADLCPGDETLQQEVELLLVHTGPASAFLETPATSESSAVVARERSLVGQRFGSYLVRSLLGAGGMGEVYCAHDERLGRDVAIKILPPLFSNDPERLARFEREARMLAALNHPHIGAIYGHENVDGGPALVLELVEGETLAERLSRAGQVSSGPLRIPGPLASAVPLKEALAIARQIAEALEAAHDRGIIHRDLKPANIKITPDGVVKVLDFGLAKLGAVEAEGSGAALTHSPTVVVHGTRDGMILGTAAYMSPEQAAGKAADKRSDLWSFGVVLLEMLTGRPVFTGETDSDVLAAVLRTEPDLTMLPAETPASIRKLLRRCLEKDRKRRLDSAADARLEIDDALATPPDEMTVDREGVQQLAVGGVARDRTSSGVAIVTPPRPRHSMYRAVGLVVLLALLFAGAVGLVYATRPSRPVTSPSEYVQLTNFTDSAFAPSLSAAGTMVTFKRGDDAFLSNGQIYVMQLPKGEPVQLTTTAGRKFGPVFTPDGSRIAYTAQTPGNWDTWTVPVGGGTPTRYLPNASGLTWIDDQRVLFSEIKTGIHMGIVTATESRADSREIYFPLNEQAMAHYSYVSPDRQSVLVVEMPAVHAFNQQCRLIPFDGSSAGRQVGPRGTCTSAAWSPDGKWMYFGATIGGQSHLWRQRFPDGVPEQITFGPLEEEGIALAPDGRSLVTSIGTRRSAIWIHDSTGERPITSEGYALVPRLSQDGTRAFYLLVRDWWLSSRGWVPSSAELRSMDLASGKSDSVLPGVSVADYDISRDEKEVAYTTRDNSGASQIWLASLDRRTRPREIARAGDQVSFGADGKLIFRSLEEEANVLVRIEPDGSGRERVPSAPFLEKLGASPDGKWVVVNSSGAGPDAVSATLAIPIHGGDSKRVCAFPCFPAWSSDGKFLYVSIRYPGVVSAVDPTLVIPLPAGQSLPDLPAPGISSTASEAELKGARVIEHGSISGSVSSTYVFTKTDLNRNLYRIPLH